MMDRRKFMMSAAGSVALFSCTVDYRRATDAEVRAAFYKHDGPPSISLMSMINEWGDKSEHSGILINGSQRVLYDPAGSYDPSTQPGWYVPPRKDDIHYGVTDTALRQYERFHARVGYYVLRQTVNVPLPIADQAIRLSQQRGETIQTQCATSVTWVLRQLAGFESISPTMFPQTVRKDFARIPGVVNKEFHEQDYGQNYQTTENLVVGDPNDTAPPPKPVFGRG